MNKYLLIVSWLLISTQLLRAMDEEAALHRHGLVELSAHERIKVPLAIITSLAALKQIGYVQSRLLYKLPAEGPYISAVTLQELVRHLKHDDRINQVQARHELKGLLRLLTSLQGPESLRQQWRARLAAIPKALEPVVADDGCLNMTGLGITSCIGLDRWKGPAVRHLILNDNSIKRFDLRELCRWFSSLKRLDVERNAFTHLSCAMVREIPASFLLNFSHNPIKNADDGIDHALCALKDRTISIWLNDTQLPENDLERCAGIVEGVSLSRRLKLFSLLSAGALTYAGGAACGIMRGALSDDQSLTIAENILLMGGLIIGIGSSATCVVLSSFLEYLGGNDHHPSKLLWH